MFEASMHRAWIHQRRAAKLFDATQTLELGRIDKPKLVAGQLNVAMDWIAKDAQAAQASPRSPQIQTVTACAVLNWPRLERPFQQNQLGQMRS